MAEGQGRLYERDSINRSKPLPRFGRMAGESPTVIRVSIHGCWSVLQTLKGWGLV